MMSLIFMNITMMTPQKISFDEVNEQDTLYDYFDLVEYLDCLKEPYFSYYYEGIYSCSSNEYLI